MIFFGSFPLTKIIKFHQEQWGMKICKIRNFMLGSIFIVMILPSSVYPQQNKNAASPQKTQGEVATDSDKYILGPEDVLYIHIWKEESMSKTVPVRMDGKISLPLVDDMQTADLTPLQLKEVLTKN